MKRFLFLGLCLVFVGAALADSVIFKSITPGVAQINAATTNNTAGTTYYFAQPQGAVRLYLTADGAAGTTSGALTVKFSTASGLEATTNNFDSAQLSQIVLTINADASTTNTVTVSDWFNMTGVRYLRVGRIENTSGAAWSNITVRIGYPSGGR